MKSPIQLESEEMVTSGCRARTPAQIVDTAQRLLRQNDIRFLKCVDCEFHEGTLVIRGCVPTYYLKQIAQTIVAGVDGVEHVDNRIEVFAHHGAK